MINDHTTYNNDSNDVRLRALTKWLQRAAPEPIQAIMPLQNDASFRRYFRVVADGHSWIAMDAPPDKENSESFILVAKGLACCGLKTPDIIEADLHQGFILLTDFGDQLYFRLLNQDNAQDNADKLYHIAMQALLSLQRQVSIPDYQLPLFNADFMQLELQCFMDWFLINYLKLDLNNVERHLLTENFKKLIKNAEEQPQALIHRDYHSRNLLLLPDDQLGIIDFQDAMIGPITYDLVSLLKDCYIAWPKERVQDWAVYFYGLLKTESQANAFSFHQFYRWFDMMGLQRHFKVLGIFTRLYLRDQKSLYLQDIPRIMDYIEVILTRYSEFEELNRLFNQIIKPCFDEVYQ